MKCGAMMFAFFATSGKRYTDIYLVTQADEQTETVTC